jgi:hypothetical protein
MFFFCNFIVNYICEENKTYHEHDQGLTVLGYSSSSSSITVTVWSKDHIHFRFHTKKKKTKHATLVSRRQEHSKKKRRRSSSMSHSFFDCGGCQPRAAPFQHHGVLVHPRLSAASGELQTRPPPQRPAPAHPYASDHLPLRLLCKANDSMTGHILASPSNQLTPANPLGTHIWALVTSFTGITKIQSQPPQ